MKTKEKPGVGIVLKSKLKLSNFYCLLMVFALCNLCSCSKTPDELQLTAVVESYDVGSIEDRYDDGTIVIFDTTKLRLNLDKELGNEIIIIHNTPPPIDSFWRQEGCVVRLRVSEDLLENGQIYSDGLSDVVVLDNLGGGS